ncbi:hypothetical protein [Kitasatospora purpeofusca]|uniref:hypothetical protein n=1 Tax=Kitasatospora purpeofusca TaxID=67352 RepID=UPI0038171CA1
MLIASSCAPSNTLFLMFTAPLMPDIWTKSANPAVLRPVAGSVRKSLPSMVMFSLICPRKPKPCR